MKHSELYAGIDLHSRNMVIGIQTKERKRIFSKRVPTELKEVLRVLEPYKEAMKGVAVESTFNWYWLVDGLLESGFEVHLANPSAIKQYEGLKHTDDKHDAFWLGHLLSLGILPEGYIYPRETRPVRDLLRCRGFLVEHRTSLILSLTSMVERWTSERKSIRELRGLTEEEVKELLRDDMLDMSALAKRGLIEELDKRIEAIEKKVMGSIKLCNPFVLLKTMPGVGNILAKTIMLEVGDISRFPRVGDFCSYARCVPSQRITNDKKKGKGNRKNGNRYLSWAFAEAAHHACKNSVRVKRYYQRKASRTKPMVAWRAISNKLARAAFFIMRDEVSFKEEGIFCS